MFLWPTYACRVAASQLVHSDSSDFQAEPLPSFNRRLCQTRARPGLAGWARGEVLEVVEHEQADRRRQIALLAVRVDFANQFGQRHAELLGNLLHTCPERRFETDAGLVAADHDR